MEYFALFSSMLVNRRGSLVRNVGILYNFIVARRQWRVSPILRIVL